MKSAVRVLLSASIGGLLLSLLTFGASPASAGEFTLNSQKIQVVHGKTECSDSATMTLDLVGHPDCEADDDLISGGLDKIALFGGTCAYFSWFCSYFWYCPYLPLNDFMGPMVSHTIAGHQYGTYFNSSEPGGCGSTTL